jgi:hypothetical protein
MRSSSTKSVRTSAAETPRITRGHAFVVAPHHRLFCVMADHVAAADLLLATVGSGDIDVKDVWVFVGDGDASRIDPAIWSHGPLVAVVRMAQRVLTSDCEYCQLLSSKLHAGGVVLAFGVGKDAAPELARIADEHGARSVVYGEHWNFMPVPATTEG